MSAVTTNPVYAKAKPAIDAAMQHYAMKFRQQALAATTPGSAQFSALSVNWYNILTGIIATITQIVQQVEGTNADKEATVEVAVMNFWTSTIQPALAQAVGMPWLFNTFIAPAISNEIPVLVQGAYQALSQLFSQFFPHPNPQPTPVPTPTPVPVPGTNLTFTPY
jgi:hypothetical protein